jgi:hypothetical protein
MSAQSNRVAFTAAAAAVLLLLLLADSMADQIRLSTVPPADPEKKRGWS